ncbi:putative glutamate synthase subunit beta [Thermococcus cleftensis]|uniref:Glutamate synthase subunit beta n=1 Tax=Thermococcus cleftensis (strain DSM 27260 / KACC 17922 / CL1) TaxID=163003 RepID=I3ZUG3_THECF|nr:FAD-dependent oxidoreductase [Thermococcus cleftensis]AFL95347.1 putative glutamate synthase subunit beta [Thermococcus cleftensis]
MNGMNFAFHCLERPEPTGKRVAIIGAGPAGLAAAGYLACKGHEVHVYDKLPEPGGLMLFAIPDFRIPVERVRLGYFDLAKRMGVKFHTGVKVISGERGDEGDEFVEKTLPFEELVRDFDAVLIATGTWRSWVADIPGIELEGVFKALEYLFRIKSAKLGHMDWKEVPEIEGKRVIVIGAGHTACDAAMESLLMGAEKVYMSYRRTIREAPAGSYEINLLREKGVEWLELTVPVRIIGENGKVKGIELKKCRLGEPDASGRRKPIPIEGSEFTVEVDYVVFAIGQTPTPPFIEGIATDRKGRIVVDSRHMTSREGIFAAGDVVLGPSLVGRATKDGLYAGRDIHLWLTGVRA